MAHNGQRAGTPARRTRVGLLVAVILMGWTCGGSKAGGSSFGLSTHHRFSDPVRAIFPPGDDKHLPEKGTVDYFVAMAARDRFLGRRLTDGNSSTAPLTFVAGNTTHRIRDYGYLYYANVSVGTPGMDFLVALDTGSDLFWLPCDCISCYKSGAGEMKFNTYGPSSSSTSKRVPCSSPMCDRSVPCSTIPNQCPYEIHYLSTNTSSSGYLVEDLIHLTTDSNPSITVDANITFGCGNTQTGIFLEGAAPNGLFGLGVEGISVPSILARHNITANSFSMCFGPDQVGRISFGDKGSSNQTETPFVLQQYRTYFVSITQVAVGKNASSNVRAAALFDTGTSFTYFIDPIYSLITEAFNSRVQDKRFQTDSDFPFEFCYQMSSCSSNIETPTIHLTMGGGASYNVIKPLIRFRSDQTCIYCLGIIKDDTINFNIIGENFMYGYRMVFDREKKVLGWEESDCNYEFKLTGYSPGNSSAAAPTATGAPGRSKGNQLITDLKHWALALFLIAIQIFAVL